MFLFSLEWSDRLLFVVTAPVVIKRFAKKYVSTNFQQNWQINQPAVWLKVAYNFQLWFEYMQRGDYMLITNTTV